MNSLKLIFVILAFFFITCSNENDFKVYDFESEDLILKNNIVKDTIIEIQKYDNFFQKGDTFTVNKTCAIFISPDSLEFEMMINKYTTEIEKEDFYTAMDDLNYYIFLAQETLEKNDIEIVNTNKQVLEFVSDNSIKNYMFKNKLVDDCGLIFFRKDSIPLEVDIIDFDLSYFN